MSAYDTRVMRGELGKILLQQGISIVVQVTSDEENSEKEPLHTYSIKFDSQAMQRFADDRTRLTGWILNGIVCHDIIDLVQVSIEDQLARLIADTVCRQSGDDVTVTANQMRSSEFASSLFGHTFHATYSRLERLPADVLGKISALLPRREAVTLGQSNKQTRDTLSGPRAGIKVIDYVSVATVLDPAHGWSRRKGVIGYFSAFKVTSLEELAHLPHEARQLRLDLPINTIVTSDILPGYIEQLTFGFKFNQPIEDLVLPVSLTHLTFGTMFNKSIASLVFPNALTHLTFGVDFNQPIEGIKLPASLTHLTFGLDFDQPIDGINLPSSLTHLTFGYEFDKSIKNLELPSSLTHLTFGFKFNQPVEGVKLPASLTHLTFGSMFNKPIEDLVLPTSLTHLTFGDMFNKPFNSVKLPASLVHLNLSYRYSSNQFHDIKRMYPLNTHLKIARSEQK